MRRLAALLALLGATVLLSPPASVGGQTTTVPTSTGQVYLVGRVNRQLFTGRLVADNATLNTWNVVSQAINANELSVNGQSLEFAVGILGANNTNTHEYQGYFSTSAAVCGGTGAALCDIGCIVLPSITNTAAFAGEDVNVQITRTASGAQDYKRVALGATTAITTGTCTITDTGATKLVFGTRNTTAGAASLAQISYWVRKW